MDIIPIKIKGATGSLLIKCQACPICLVKETAQSSSM